MMQKAQGTIEYLVILAVIIIVSLIVISLITNSVSSTEGISTGSSKVAAWTNSLSVTETAISPDGNYLIRLANNTGAPITIKTVSVNGEEVNFSEDLFQGSQQNFKVSSDIVCEIGQTITSDLTVKYVSEHGLEKTEKYPLDVAFACDDYVVSLLANQCPDCTSIQAPETPINIIAVTKGAEVEVTFTPAGTCSFPIDGYTVISNPLGGTDIDAGTTNLTHTITGLNSGTEYTFTVISSNSAGTSSPSSPSEPVIPNDMDATGGTISFSGGYKIHTFTEDGTFSVFGSGGVVEILVVAGGGGGASGTGGGGGAGGLIYNPSYLVSGDIIVTVGAGGDGAASGGLAQPGENSIFGTLTAIGGGRGNSGDGGSGGGSGYVYPSGTRSGGLGTLGQGNNGGSSTSSSNCFGAAGGGGAGEVGANATCNSGNGGDGLEYDILEPLTYYAGGGGGGADSHRGRSPGLGGAGGGGNGGYNSNGDNALPNTGGGGGGGSNNRIPNYSGGNGGSGIVIIKYPYIS